MDNSIKNRHYQFASDNYSGICTEALNGIIEANNGYALAYGNDEYTAKASDMLRELFDIDCEVFFVFNGTAANSLALATLCQSYHSIICHELAHIETDECGAPEFYSNGTKLLTITGKNGKVDLQEAEKTVTRRSDIHYPKPHVLSITQPTEAGTVYSIAELQEIQWFTKKYGLKLHVDGARFANAVASLGCHPADITWRNGVDVLCFGGTKMGIPVGEAVVFFNRTLAKEFAYRCKQAGQLASKMRFLSASWLRMLQNDKWLQYAQKANEAAQYFYSQISEIEELNIAYPVQANTVFLEMPLQVNEALKQKGWYYYNFIGTGYSRIMFSWNTNHEDVNKLIDDLKQAINSSSSA